MRESEIAHSMCEFEKLVDSAIKKRNELLSVLQVKDLIAGTRYPDAFDFKAGIAAGMKIRTTLDVLTLLHKVLEKR